MNRSSALALAVFAAVIFAASLVGGRPRPVPPALDLADGAFARNDLLEAERLYAKTVEEGSASKDPQVQDQVASAQMGLGHIAARRGDFASARRIFLRLASSYKGTGASSPEFGSLPDQAAYQAIASLSASGDKAGARKELVRFLLERPSSPLVYGAMKRIEAIDGKISSQTQALFDRIVKAQTEHLRAEMAMCGPKAVAWLADKGLVKLGESAKQLAALSGTSDGGTTMAGLQAGLAKAGVDSFGYQVNRQDFARLKTPFLWLSDGHYVAVLAVDFTRARLYDPFGDSERTVTLPPYDDPEFQADVLAFAELPSLAASPQRANP